jgi:ABC-type multidrug transport system ATPase subunit
VSGLEKAFDGRPVLRGVDLEVHGEEAVALVGANGSGKTTTLRAIIGLTIPDRGAIRLGQLDVLRHPRESRRRMSYMPQRPVFPETLTAREILDTVARLRGIGPWRVDEEIAACGLDAFASHRVAELSGGQRQRLALAATLLPDAELYLFDEPSASLDRAAIDLLVQRVSALRTGGRGVLFTTHVASDLEALSTRVERIQDGWCHAVVEERSSDGAQVPRAAGPRGERLGDRLCRSLARA